MDLATFQHSVGLLKHRLNNLIDDITNITEQGRLVESNPSSFTYFKGMFRTLDATYNKLTEVWNELLYLHITNQKESEFPAESDKTKLDAVKRLYFEAGAIYENFNATLGNTNQSMNANLSANPANFTVIQPIKHRLPIIHLPQFSGKPIEWTLFRDTFNSLVHNVTTLSKIEKYHYLIGSLSGPPLSLIRCLKLSEENYERAWEALNAEYNHERELASSYLKQIINFKPLQGKATSAALKQYVSAMKESVSALKNLQIPDLAEYILFELTIKNLDQPTREAFELENVDTAFPRFSILMDFVNERAQALDRSHAKPETSFKFKPTFNLSNPNRFQQRKTQSSGFDPTSATFFSNSCSSNNTSNINHAKSSSKQDTPPTSKKSPCCFLCHKFHKLTECPTYTSADVNQRINLLRGWNGCRNCLHPSHHTKDCTSKWNCHICHGRHHSTLHIPRQEPASSVQPSSTQSKQSAQPKQISEPSSSTLTASTFTGISPSVSGVLLGTALASIKDYRGNFVTIRLVVDSGSQNSFITESCRHKLGLPMNSLDCAIHGVGEVPVSDIKGKVSCCLRPLSSTTCSDLTTNAVVVRSIISFLPQRTIPATISDNYRNFDLADPQFFEPGPIDFLLGADLFADILTGPPIILSANIPRLLKTVFGHVLVGKIDLENSSDSNISLFVATSENIAPLLYKFWEIEEPAPTTKLSPEDQYCEEHFKNTHQRLSCGRYVVSLPFRDSSPTLGSSKQQALNRFMTLELKLSKNPSLKADYHRFMQEYIDLGHMEKTSIEASYIIPHHGVRNKAKLRVVFDGSAKTSTGSLNDHLLPGPKLQLDISNILLNFRRHRVAFTADMVRMFRQILVNRDDRKFQHILWRFDPSQPIDEYQLNTVTYGLTTSPYLAIRVVRQLVSDEGHSFPAASKVLLEQTYVDDIVTGASSLSEALSLKSELEELLSKGGFSLSKWCSNSPELVDQVSNENQISPVTLTSNEDQGIKILGLQWEPILDTFVFKVDIPAFVFTKRAILSTIARIYDPLGYVAPVVFYAKRVLQEIWKLGIDWDQKVPDDIIKAWKEYLETLPFISTIKIPRYIQLDEDVHRCYIIGFADASQHGYCAVLYLRLDLTTSSQCFLIKAKTKLSPTKTLTIPRLELCSAVLLTKLLKSISSFISTLPAAEIILFTDSTIVLSWLRTPSYQLKTFVAHRVVEILDTTELTSWRHISTDQNPADCGSRGLQPLQLIDHPLWWAGPSWLSSSLDQWPVSHFDIPSDLPELKSSQVSLSSTTSEVPYLITCMERFNSYTSLIFSFAYMLRFIQYLRQPISQKLNSITCHEFRSANLQIIRILQHHYYQEAFKENTKWSNLLLSLNVFKDTEGILRVGGRLLHSSLPRNHIYPILLPKKSHFTNILVDYYHKINLHIGPTALLAIIRQKYWIPSARQLLNQRKSKCSICFKFSAVPKPPFMGNLPSSRFTEVRPFYHTGVDFAGPLLCKETGRRKSPTIKVYLCLFICFSTKAIHLEVATSLSTEAFLDALDKFIARRGVPAKILSDCGTNFVGAASYMKDVLKWYNDKQTQQTILKYSVPKGIHWSFNPPSAPHMGGLWEAGVKSAKTLIRKTVGSHLLTLNELITLITKIEGILNSRPLVPLSQDPNDLTPLTPGHFLIGGPLTALPEIPLNDININLLNRWQLIRERTQNFWERWRREYLTELQQRKKWLKSQPNIKIGDLVLLQQDHLPPLQWPLGRIIQVYPGSDNISRVVTVKTSKGEFKRPVAKLVSLTPLLQTSTSEED